MKIKSIGLLDYDALYQKKYIAPNYDLGITYNYLSKDLNLSTRLITTFSEDNLSRYDEIYIFKISPYLAHPSSIIKNYYNYNIKEFGPGFINRESRPMIKETYNLKPNFKCYNPIIKFSYTNPYHPMAWNLKKMINPSNKQQIRLYELLDGEFLRKDIPTKCKSLVIHDNPNILFTTPNQLETIDNFLLQKYHLFFTQPLDIALLKDTNIIERVINDPNLATLRKMLFISQINDSALWFINYYITHKRKKTDVVVLLDKGKKSDYYLSAMLEMNYYNRKSDYYLRLRPYWDKRAIITSPLTHCAYRFLFVKPFLMSFYEYVFYMGCKNIKVPEKLIRTNEDIYDFILDKYGMPELVKDLEDWIRENPQYEEYVFIGGTSDYKDIRDKYYYKIQDKWKFISN